jgi:hypothetical protein
MHAPVLRFPRRWLWGSQAAAQADTGCLGWVASCVQEAEVKDRLKKELTADFEKFEAAMVEKAQFYE